MWPLWADSPCSPMHVKTKESKNETNLHVLHRRATASAGKTVGTTSLDLKPGAPPAQGSRSPPLRIGAKTGRPDYLRGVRRISANPFTCAELRDDLTVSLLQARPIEQHN